ncbi:MAG: ribosomal protein S19 family protein [Candidatus Diapherotrites archaeon]|nr:ribosomal protein S19 family protein [Candidatus Diapherotrites archaeon]
MAKTSTTYRGKTIEELKKMGTEEFAKLLTSRARRSLLHGVNKPLDKKIDEAVRLKQPNKIIRTHDRDAIVTPKMLGVKLGVHSGNQFQQVEITLDMLGHKLGELALTRKRLKHGKAGVGATKSSTAITARG